MKIRINKNLFLNNLLGPVSKLADNLLLEFASRDDLCDAKTMVASSDNSVILLGKVECEVEEPFRCVIPDCKTFLRLFSGVSSDDINLVVDSNVIKYKDSSFSFKYHLLDESYLVNKKSLSEDKLNALTFDTTFSLTKQKFSEIIKFNSIVPDAEKLYFYTDGLGSVLAKLGDEQKSNSNEIVTEVAGLFAGKSIPNPIPINIQSILLFAFNSEQINVSINQALKIFKFSTENLTYIVSGLVK